MSEIIPSILVKTREEVVDKILKVEGQVERVHLDIADGIFVPNITVSEFDELESIETELGMDVHLMVSKPENHIVKWLESPAERFVFHVESTEKAQEVIDKIKEAERLVGMALNPNTSAQALEPYIEQIDFVHFMTVEPGFYGGKFLDSVLDKITDFHYFYPDKPIQVDGGVNPDTVERLAKAGVSMFVVGSFIFNGSNIGSALKELRDIIK
jgi:ribulose-phosphate 3-epimerase